MYHIACIIWINIDGEKYYPRHGDTVIKHSQSDALNATVNTDGKQGENSEAGTDQTPENPESPTTGLQKIEEG